jgi:peptidoglycan DL-endopeptidase CwlO
VDGVTAVQARIGEIQARFMTQAAVARAASANWTQAASAAGLTGTATTAAASGLSGGGTASEAAVVTEAGKYLGVPYLWGGTDPAKGLDCSGFTQLVFGNLGIGLPRVSSQQATAGRAVASLASARPGDLVFFDNASSRPGIDHVGIYVGNGQMIAAPQPGESVKIQPVGTPSVIRRVLPESTAVSSVLPAASASSLGGVPYADLFTRAGSRHGVDPALLAAVAKRESGFDSRAVSPAGAQGLMQFMPATARGLGVNPLDPTSAVDGAARYLKDLTQQFGSTSLALAAYNAGPGTVSRYGGIPPFPETQNYVRAVMDQAEAYR